MDAPSLTAAVRRELRAHPEVTEGWHRFGGVVFHVGDQEIGHIHADRVADLRFPPHIRDELLAGGRVSRDDVVSDSAFVSRSVERPQDVAEIVELFRISYEHAAIRAAQAREEAERAASEVPDEPESVWRGLWRRAFGGRHD